MSAVTESDRVEIVEDEPEDSTDPVPASGEAVPPSVPSGVPDSHADADAHDDTAATASDSESGPGTGPASAEEPADGSVEEADGGDGGVGAGEEEGVVLSEREVELATEQATTAKELGNTFFRTGEYEKAANCYGEALDAAPRHPGLYPVLSVLFSNRAACGLALERYEDAVADASGALELDPKYIKARMRRSTAYEKLEKLDDALADVKVVLEQDPGNRAVAHTVARLQKAVDERNEKLKDEMLGKLKDMGNSLLGKFGMSLDNFQMQKDPKTGSYSINMKQ